MDDKGQMSFQAEGTHKRFIAVGLCSAESIVTMNHRELEAPWVSQTMKERYQRNRVSPARHRYEHVVTGMEQLLLPHCPNKLGQQRRL
jgi:hypothetical protein